MELAEVSLYRDTEAPEIDLRVLSLLSQPNYR